MRKIAALTMIVMTVLLALSASPALGQDRGVKSDSALPFYVDIERIPGWMVYAEAGYEWNLFRKVGIGISQDGNGSYNTVHQRNFTEGGVAGSIALGYNFSPRFPLTLGFEFDLGPSDEFSMTSQRADGSFLRSWQRIDMYNLDFALDYDFKTRSRFTPFAGITLGGSLVSQKANATVYDGDDLYKGGYGTKHRINISGGARTGVKWDLNKRIAMTAFGQYTYVGNVKGRKFDMTNDAGDVIHARTTSAKVHVLEIKAGIRIAF